MEELKQVVVPLSGVLLIFAAKDAFFRVLLQTLLFTVYRNSKSVNVDGNVARDVGVLYEISFVAVSVYFGARDRLKKTTIQLCEKWLGRPFNVTTLLLREPV